MITKEQWISITKEIDEPLKFEARSAPPQSGLADGTYRPYFFDDVYGESLIFKSKDYFLTTKNALDYAKQYINKLTGNNKTLVMAEILGDNRE